MTSARILGLSFLLAAAAVGCDDSTTTGGGPITASGGGTATGGGTGTGGGTATGGGTSTGGGTQASGVPLTLADGWVDAAGNTLMIQGAVFAYADTHTAETMATPPADIKFTGATACIAGTAALVDMLCTPVAPATDCYGEFWGAAIGFNLNQTVDPVSGEGSDPLPYDASALTGFGFTISGTTVPTSLRFKVENAAGEFCTPPTTKPILTGPNTVLFSEVIKDCWTAGGANPELTAITKIAWQVVTNDSAEVPFDFCVGDIVAVQ